MARPTLLVVIGPRGESPTLYVASAMYCTYPGDTPSNELFHERIADAEYERAVTFKWWSRSSTATSIKFLDLYNSDGYFDAFINEEWRNVVVSLYLVEERAAFSTAEAVGYFLVENIATPDAGIFRLNGYSTLQQLDRIITTNYSDSISNVQSRSKPRPICLGYVRWALPILKTLNDPAGYQRGIHEIADGHFENIVSVRHRGEFQAESSAPLVTNANPRYHVVSSGSAFGFLWRDQTYKLAAEVNGQLRLAEQLLLDPTFSASWLTYWTADIGDGSAVESAGVVTLSSSGGTNNGFYQNVTTTVGDVYHIQVNVDSSPGGVWSIAVDGTGIRELEYVSGLLTASFVATGTTSRIEILFFTGAAGVVSVTSVHCYHAYRIDNIGEIARFVAERLGVATTIFDLTLLDSLTGPPIGFFTEEEVSGAELLATAAASFNASLYQNRLGVIVPIMLYDPIYEVTDFTFNEIDVDGDLEFEPDMAPGLATRLRYARNYNVHSLDDVAGLPPSGTGVPELRAALQREYQTVTAVETPHSAYADAATREPYDSLISDETDAQNNINTVVGLYVSLRGFYTFRARSSAIALYTIEPGNIIDLYHSRYGLSGGKKLFVVYAKSSFLNNVIDLVLWG